MDKGTYLLSGLIILTAYYLSVFTIAGPRFLGAVTALPGTDYVRVPIILHLAGFIGFVTLLMGLIKNR